MLTRHIILLLDMESYSSSVKFLFALFPLPETHQIWEQSSHWWQCVLVVSHDSSFYLSSFIYFNIFYWCVDSKQEPQIQQMAHPDTYYIFYSTLLLGEEIWQMCSIDNLMCPFHLDSLAQKEAHLSALITEVWPPVVDDGLSFFNIFSMMGKQSTAIHRL